MRELICGGFLISIIACSNIKDSKDSSMSPNSEYQDQHRLQFHFSPKEKWMNDPNGLVYHNGEYHMFYQYYPDSTVWGPMHWGHAVSNDLMHWEHLPIALYPDSLGYIFSGSAVVDRANTSGFGSLENPPLIAIFTYHDTVGEKAGSYLFQTQGIAYSLDNGRSWTKYDQNPVLENPGIKDFRDPNVFWSEKYSKWIMALAVKDHISFYSSPDLKTWNFESDFGESMGGHGGVWECPDLFVLDNKWVLLVSINPGGPNGGSATQYFIGDFDGKTFTPDDTETRWLDYGRDNYAGVTWHNIPKEDGRRIFLGWLSNWDYANLVPTEKWRSAMTVPRELKLAKNESGIFLQSIVVDELKLIQGTIIMIEESKSDDIILNKKGWTTYDLELALEADNPEDQSFNITFSNRMNDILVIGFNSSEKSFFIDRDKAGDNNFADKFNGVQKAGFASKVKNIRILLDEGSIELFVNDGELNMSSLFFPREPLNQAKFSNQSDKVIKVSGQLHELNSIWK